MIGSLTEPTQENAEELNSSATAASWELPDLGLDAARWEVPALALTLLVIAANLALQMRRKPLLSVRPRQSQQQDDAPHASPKEEGASSRMVKSTVPAQAAESPSRRISASPVASDSTRRHYHRPVKIVWICCALTMSWQGLPGNKLLQGLEDDGVDVEPAIITSLITPHSAESRVLRTGLHALAELSNSEDEATLLQQYHRVILMENHGMLDSAGPGQRWCWR